MTTTQQAGPGTDEPSPASVRPTHGAETALRLTVLGASGRVDLAVPMGLDVASLAREYADLVGLSAAPALARAGGRALPPDATLEQVLEQGDLVVVAATGRTADPSEPAAAAARGPRRVTGRVTGRAAAALLVLAGVAGFAAAAVGAGLSFADDAPVWVRPVAAAVLLLGALLVAAPRPDGEEPDAAPTAGDDWSFLAGPGLAGAAGFTLAASPDAGGLLLALAVGGLAALVVAALARTGLEGADEHLARMWLVTGGLVCVLAVAWLLLGASPLALAAVGFAAAVVATRVLPAFAVDVDDDVLLDLDRLAVTAWSAREQPRGGRRRHQVRPRLVHEVARRSQRTVGTGVVVSAVTASVTGLFVVLGLGGDPTTWARWGGFALVVLGASSLALVSRSFRSPVLRTLLGVTALWLVALTGTAVAGRLGHDALWYSFAAAVLVAPLVVVSAVRLGGGWRSVWWARVGEVLETTTGVLVVALVPLACGLFDLVRTSVG
ncbi:hypothetical protein SAMN04488570_3210 [Nocardioides scoriae]|uniref:EccD-like transmembrane domain-containing protein n=1 Tax=Nocardioides scoriae TaxID=642780 RepID=A0A1H1WMQ8_9ACTN|nr:hypothetical protein [Nocardioides scoriae]SDS98453.1 hypothetical protein SAMN04488570_3210 [Nocardioides scoriae]